MPWGVDLTGAGDDLDRRRSLPAGATVEHRAMADGWPIRAAGWSGGTRGSILFLNGRGDFIEKYAEAYHDWRDRGFGLATFDWRGQGGSGRLLADTQKCHAVDFAPWLSDLAEQVQWFKVNWPAPHFAVAHSMGGHLLLRHLEADPDAFDRAVLLSPMTGLRALPLGPFLARLLAHLLCGLGKVEDYVPGGGPLVRGVVGSTRQQRLTSDAARYSDEGWWLDAHPELAVGAITNGWLRAAFRSIDALRAPGALERVTTPLMILLAENEALVDNAATVRAAKRIHGAWLQTVPGAAHELVHEVDAIRLPLLDGIAGFLE